MANDSLLSGREYLTFLLGKEEYGVDILCVQEIRVWSPVTEIPNTPSYLKGVINLRGTIVPIVDLRQRFGYEAHEYCNTTVVVVLKGLVRDKKATVGIVVDAVSDVHKVDAGGVKDAPEFGQHVDSCFIRGMVTDGDKIIILLDSIALLDVDELFKDSSGITQKAG